MIRVCIQCKHIFGCQGYDGRKWQCNNCGKSDPCNTRDMLDPPVEEITGGICDWCFENLVLPKLKKASQAGAKHA